MKSVLVRLLARERGLFAGALVIAAACIALGVPLDFVLFGLTLLGERLNGWQFIGITTGLCGLLGFLLVNHRAHRAVVGDRR